MRLALFALGILLLLPHSVYAQAKYKLVWDQAEAHDLKIVIHKTDQKSWLVVTRKKPFEVRMTIDPNSAAEISKALKASRKIFRGAGPQIRQKVKLGEYSVEYLKRPHIPSMVYLRKRKRMTLSSKQALFLADQLQQSLVKIKEFDKTVTP